MANVALVYPPDHDIGPKRHHPYWDHGHDLHIAYLNLGLGYIAANLRRHGHQVTVLDGLLFGIPLGGLIERLRAGDYDVIGVALPAHETVVDGILLVEGIADCPAHVTVGGNYATFEAEAILANMPRVDSVVCGEGEVTTLELVESVERERRLNEVAGLALRHGGSIGRTPPRKRYKTLDELPFPDRDGTRPSPANALVPLATSRGCYADCSFCYNRGFFGSGIVMRRSVRHVVDEIEMLKHRHRTRRFIFEDLILGDRSPSSVRWLEALAREVQDRGLDISFSGMLRIDDCVPELLLPLKRAGLSYLFAGAESASDDVLARLTKWLDAEQIDTALRNAERAEVHLELGFIMFEPDMSLDDLIVNYGLIRQHFERTDHGNLFKRIWPLAGTAVRRKLLAESRLRLRTWYDEGDYEFLDPEVGLAYATVGELKPSFHRLERGYSALWYAADEIEQRRGSVPTALQELAVRWIGEATREKDRLIAEVFDDLFDRLRRSRRGAIPQSDVEAWRAAFHSAGERMWGRGERLEDDLGRVTAAAAKHAAGPQASAPAGVVDRAAG